MYFDGALNLEGAGAGVLLISPQGEQLEYVLQIHYKASNNGAEYEALIHGLRITVSLGIKRLLAFGDSKVVICDNLPRKIPYYRLNQSTLVIKR
jgi:ribonuclease HI